MDTENNAEHCGLVEASEAFFKRLKWSESDFDQMKRAVDFVDSFLTKEISDKNVFELFGVMYHSLVSKIPLPACYVKPKYIIRGRPNEDAANQFTCEDEISYNKKNRKKVGEGRFNRYREGLFYGSVPSDSPAVTIATATLECCKEIISGPEPLDTKTITLGKWEPFQEFPVINLCFNEQTLSKNHYLKVDAERYLGELQANVDRQTFEYLRYFWKYVSYISSTKATSQNHYLLSISFFNSARLCYAKMKPRVSVNGIIYPSNATQNDGVNIVLLPNAVDNYLKLTEVCLYRYEADKSMPLGYIAAPSSERTKVVNSRFEIVENLKLFQSEVLSARQKEI